MVSAVKSIGRTVPVLVFLAGLTACSWWRGPRGGEPVGPRLTSFDDLLPADISAILYLPDLSRMKERFDKTELARRLREQELSGAWRRVEFLRPWVRAAYNQIVEQVDELACGRYAGETDGEWFLIARLNQPARVVLSHLHKKVLPRVSDEIPAIRLESGRSGGRRLYEWRTAGQGVAKTIAAYTLADGLLVMGSDPDFVRRAIDRRPLWWLFSRGRSGEERLDTAMESRRLVEAFRPESDVFAWLRMARNENRQREPAPSRLARIAARLREIVASRIEVASVNLECTPPQITGRWRVVSTQRHANEQQAQPPPFDFAALVPRTARTFIAIHRLPLGDVLLDELRDVLSDALSPGAADNLRDLLPILKVIPGLSSLGRAFESFDGRLAYCSLPVDAGEKVDRCIFVALENPAALQLTLRFVPSFLSRVLESSEYRDVPYLHAKVPLPWSADGILIFVVRGALAITVHKPILEEVIDVAGEGASLAGLPIVGRLRPLPRDSVLAEFYTQRGPKLNDASKDDISAEEGLEIPWLRSMFGDKRLDTLIAGRAYSLCLQHPDGLEIVTSSTTGFHWSLATVGLGAIVVDKLPAGDLFGGKAFQRPRALPENRANE